MRNIISDCAGGCGAIITYQIELHTASAPEVYPVCEQVRVAYAGGHLCSECAAIVREALNVRRKAVGK